jgi:hypothetical protein
MLACSSASAPDTLLPKIGRTMVMMAEKCANYILKSTPWFFSSLANAYSGMNTSHNPNEHTRDFDFESLNCGRTTLS